MVICWKRAVPLAFHLCCFNFSAVLVVRVPFLFGVWGRLWNSIVSVPDHCLFIYFRLELPQDRMTLYSSFLYLFPHSDIRTYMIVTALNLSWIWILSCTCLRLKAFMAKRQVRLKPQYLRYKKVSN